MMEENFLLYYYLLTVVQNLSTLSLLAFIGFSFFMIYLFGDSDYYRTEGHLFHKLKKPFIIYGVVVSIFAAAIPSPSAVERMATLYIATELSKVDGAEKLPSNLIKFINKHLEGTGE
jgi:hypothetical protein